MCAIDKDRKPIFQTVRSEPAEIIAKLSKLKGDITLIGLEACPLSERIYGAVQDAGFPVFCLVVQSRHLMDRIEPEPLRFSCPCFADVLVGCEAS